MTTLSVKETKDNRLIKSWFGFFFGASLFVINLSEFFDSFSLESILKSLAFLFFWILWSQKMGWGWNPPITKPFDSEAETTKLTILNFYLPFIALILLVISFII